MVRKSEPTALLIVGNQPGTIESAAKAIVTVLGAATTEAAQVAACHTLSELARAPQHSSIANCTFTTATQGRSR